MTAKEKLEAIVAGILIFGGIWGGLSYFAKAEDLKLVEVRLDQKIVEDRAGALQSRIWVLEEKNSNKPLGDWSNPSDREEYKKLKDQLEKANKHLDILIQKAK